MKHPILLLLLHEDKCSFRRPAKPHLEGSISPFNACYMMYFIKLKTTSYIIVLLNYMAPYNFSSSSQ